MRRILMVSACLGVLACAGATTALARGPQHRPPAVRYGNAHHGVPRYNAYYRGGHGPYCAPRRRAVAYPVYTAPVYTSYPQLGFGIAGRNFSFWLQR